MITVLTISSVFTTFWK